MVYWLLDKIKPIAFVVVLVMVIFITSVVTKEFSREEAMSDHFLVEWEYNTSYKGYRVVTEGNTDFEFPVWDSCGAGDCNLTSTIVHEKYKNLMVKGLQMDTFIEYEYPVTIKRLTMYEYVSMCKSVELRWPKMSSAHEYIIYKLVPIGKTSKRLDPVYRSCERNCTDNAEGLSIPVGPGEEFKVFAATSMIQLRSHVEISEF